LYANAGKLNSIVIGGKSIGAINKDGRLQLQSIAGDDRGYVNLLEEAIQETERPQMTTIYLDDDEADTNQVKTVLIDSDDDDSTQKEKQPRKEYKISGKKE